MPRPCGPLCRKDAVERQRYVFQWHVQVLYVLLAICDFASDTCQAKAMSRTRPPGELGQAVAPATGDIGINKSGSTFLTNTDGFLAEVRPLHVVDSRGLTSGFNVFPAGPTCSTCFSFPCCSLSKCKVTVLWHVALAGLYSFAAVPLLCRAAQARGSCRETH